MKRSVACILFKTELLKVYKKKGIIVAFFAYLGFLAEFCKDKRYTEFTDWQIADMCMSLINDKIDNSREALETLWNYTRRGGKSRGLTIIAVFFALLGLMVVWRAPHSDQLIQAAEWFSMNPFVEEQKIRTQFRVGVFGSPEISVAVLSEGRIASREADVLIYDEGGSIMTWHQNYDYYRNSRPMIAASRNKYIIHASTDSQGSVFNETFKELQIKEHYHETRYTSVHPWRDTTWITQEWIEQEKKSHLNCSWYIDQNYNCIAVVRGGRIFTNLILVGNPRFPDFPYGCMDDMVGEYYGVDFNGENTGHYIVNIAYDDKYVYVLSETVFWDLSDLFQYENYSVEVEDGLFNNAFTDQLKRMGLSCLYQQWNEDLKTVRVQELVNREIVIDQYLTPVTYKNLLEAGWDENQRLPKLAKRTDQHGLDALLHAIHGVEGKIYVKNIAAEEKDLFGRLKIKNPIYRL